MQSFTEVDPVVRVVNPSAQAVQLLDPDCFGESLYVPTGQSRQSVLPSSYCPCSVQTGYTYSDIVKLLGRKSDSSAKISCMTSSRHSSHNSFIPRQLVR